MPAVSKAQRKLFGLALAVKRGEVDASTVDQKIRDLSKKKEADLKDYAETPEETLPNKLEDSVDEAAYDDPIKKNAEKRYKDHKTVSIVGIGKPFERIKVIPKGKYKIVEGDMEGRYSSPRFNVTLSKPMKPFDLAVQLAQETGWISPWNYLEMKKDHDRELGKSLTFPRAKTLFDESVDEGLSVIFEFPDEESARQFDLDIENSAIGIGDQVGNRVTVTNVDTKWRSTVKKYMKKNGGMAVKESSNKHLEEAIAYAEAMRYAIEENNAMATPGSVNGMGNVSLPGNPGTQAEFSTQETGSGDLAASSELTDDEEENEKQAKNIYNFLKFNAFVGESLNEGKVKVPKTIKSTSGLEKYFYGSDLKKAKEVWGKSFGYHLTAADDKSYFVSFDGKKRVIKLTDLKESLNEGKSEIWPRFKWDGRGLPFNFMKFKKFPKNGTDAEKMYHWHEDFAVAAIECGRGGGCREYEKQAEEHYQKYLSAIKANESVNEGNVSQ